MFIPAAVSGRIMRSQRSQAQKAMYCLTSFLRNVQSSKSTQTEGIRRLFRTRRRELGSACQGVGGSC